MTKIRKLITDLWSIDPDYPEQSEQLIFWKIRSFMAVDHGNKMSKRFHEIEAMKKSC